MMDTKTCLPDQEEWSSERQMPAYAEAVRSGLYAKRSGLVGKYDNVRRYWEDETTRQFLAPHLGRLIERRRAEGRQLRIMDLGCGSADGYELLCGIRDEEACLQDSEACLLTPQVLGFYKGVDLSTDLLEQARSLYEENGHMRFEQGDFTQGLPQDESEENYDLYFMSYATASHHMEDETLIALLAEMARASERGGLIVCDWLGRYSYEWQPQWTRDHAGYRIMDYNMSYIYEEAEREQRRDSVERLQLRLMSRVEAEAIIAEATARAGKLLRPVCWFDRSITTGRHFDTREYNPHTPPLRRAVNSLHEPGQRTDLESLLFEYVSKPGFDELNSFFVRLQYAWNSQVRYLMHLMDSYDETQGQFIRPLPPIPPTYTPVMRETLGRMRLLVENIACLDGAMPLENVIEPQLGYALQRLVNSMQLGLGCAHGFACILEIEPG